MIFVSSGIIIATFRTLMSECVESRVVQYLLKVVGVRTSEYLPQKTKTLIIIQVLPKDEDLPGEGQYYCISCAKYFVSQEARKAHLKSKVHKRRLQAMLDEPHTQKDAEEAGKH